MQKSVDDLEFAGAPKRGSAYDGIFRALEKLPIGKAHLVPLTTKDGEELDPRTAHHRLNAALRRGGPPPPKGYRWTKRTTKDGHMAIYAVKIKK